MRQRVLDYIDFVWWLYYPEPYLPGSERINALLWEHRVNRAGVRQKDLQTYREDMNAIIGTFGPPWFTHAQ